MNVLEARSLRPQSYGACFSTFCQVSFPGFREEARTTNIRNGEHFLRIVGWRWQTHGQNEKKNGMYKYREKKKSVDSFFSSASFMTSKHPYCFAPNADI